MVRFLIRAAIYLGSAALGLLAATLLPGFSIGGLGFLVTVIVFALAQSLLSPFILKMAARYAPAIIGGIGIVSTLVALLIANFVPDGIVVDGIVTWFLAALIVWLVTALAGWLLPLWFLKEKMSDRKTVR